VYLLKPDDMVLFARGAAAMLRSFSTATALAAAFAALIPKPPSVTWIEIFPAAFGCCLL